MDKDKAKTRADNLVRRFESMERQLPGQYTEALSFARTMAQLLSSDELPPREEMQALLASGRNTTNPDCALQEGLYALSALLRSRPRRVGESKG
jgi:hypothetical protein